MSDTDVLLSRAKSALLARDYSLAAKLYKTLISENPDEVAYKIQLGNLYVRSGKDDLALDVFKQIRKSHPSDIDTLMAMSGIFRRQKKYDESIAVLEQALVIGADIPKKNAEISYNLGFTYRLMGNYAEAVRAFESVIEENPQDVLTYNHIGAIYALKGKHAKAIESYQRGLKFDPNHPVLQFNLARSYAELGDIQKAFYYYEGALKAKPGWQDAIEEYANLLIKANMVKEADEVVSQALKFNPDDVKIHTSMGNVLNRQSYFDSAEVEFKKALNFNSEYKSALTGLAHSQQRQQKYEEATKTIQKAADLHPEDTEILKQSADILLSAKHFSEAYNKISKLWDKNKNDPKTVSLLGQYYICRGEKEKLASCLKKLQSVAPDYTEAYRDWGHRFMQRGETKDAEQYLLTAVNSNPRDAEAMFYLGELFENQDRHDEAFEMYRKANQNDRFNSMSKKAEDRLVRSGKVAGSPFANTENALDLPDQLAPQTEIDENDAPEEDNLFAELEGRAPANQPEESEQVAPVDSDDPKAGEAAAQEDAAEESSDSSANAEKSDDDEFDFEQFGIDNLIEGEDEQPVSVDDLMQMEDMDSTEGTPTDFEELIDDGAPVDAGDNDEFVSMPDGSSDSFIPDGDSDFGEDEDISGSKVGRKDDSNDADNFFSEPFEDENLDDDLFAPTSAEKSIDDNSQNLPSPKKQPPVVDEDEPVYLSNPKESKLADDTIEKLNSQLRQITDIADRANAVAEKALDAVNRASQVPEVDIKKLADDLEEKLGARIDEHLKNQVPPKTFEPKAEDPAESIFEEPADDTNSTLFEEPSNDSENIFDEPAFDLPDDLAETLPEDLTEEQSVLDEISDTEEAPAEDAALPSDEELPAEADDVALEDAADASAEDETAAEETLAEENESGDENYDEYEMPLSDEIFSFSDSLMEDEEPENSEPENTESEDEKTDKDVEDTVAEKSPIADSSLLEHAIEMLPTIVAAIENQNMLKKFLPSLELFKKLREMLSYLPEESRKEFFTSRNRLMLDFIIAKLSGTPGLFETARALRSSGLIKISSDIKPSESEGVQLAAEVFSNLRELSSHLEDETLREALDREADFILGMF